ncbi:LamG domain-containing protein [bacterium]|jgi:hypothetical protein|nr:LamG domain-containing protein [bacterium]
MSVVGGPRRSTVFTNTKSFYNFLGTENNLPATADVGDLSYLESQSNMTFSVWFKTPNNVDNLNFNFLFIGEGRNSYCRVQLLTDATTQSFNLGLSSVVMTSRNTKTITIDTWYHLLYTWNGTNGSIYFDGNSQTIDSETPESFSTFGTAKPQFFGGTGTLSPYNATQVAIWNRILTTQEISDVYNNGCPSDLTSLNPNNWLKIDDAFDNGLGITLPDSGSDNANIQSIQLFSQGILTDSPCP